MYYLTKTLAIFIFIIYELKNVLANEELSTEVDKIIDELSNNEKIRCNDNLPTSWCLPRDYDKQEEPWKYRNLIGMPMPWFYYLNYKVFDLREVNDKEQTISMDLNVKMKWYEPRIEINFTQAKAIMQITNIDNEDHITMPLKYFKKFWIPDSEIYHIKKFETISILTPTASFRVNKEKRLRYVARANVVLSCKMDFERYPFDSQKCEFRHGSFYNPMEIVNCTSETFHYEDRQRRLQYDIQISELPQKLHAWESEGRLWATCGFMIELKRKKIQILFQVYFTSTLLVVISWVSFIIDPNVIPGRMGLLVTVFLMLITVFMGVKLHAPASSGFLNAADEFLVVCIAEIFFAFLEYAFVLHFNKYESEKFLRLSTGIKSQSSDGLTQSPAKNKVLQLVYGWIKELQTPTSPNRYNMLDRLSIFLFPFSFILFGIAYFISYYVD